MVVCPARSLGSRNPIREHVGLPPGHRVPESAASDAGADRGLTQWPGVGVLASAVRAPDDDVASTAVVGDAHKLGDWVARGAGHGYSLSWLPNFQNFRISASLKRERRKEVWTDCGNHAEIVRKFGSFTAAAPSG